MSAAVDSVTPANDGSRIDWVVLTRGDRPTALAAAVASLRTSSTTGSIVVLLNGPADDATVELDGHADGLVVVESAENLGVPGGRDLGLRSTRAPLVGFLDDDARLVSTDSLDRVVEQFATDPSLGAMSLRLVDEDGNTSRRHVPRRGAAGADRSGPVATFLGGASIVRRSAYLQAGGYWADLVYGHEELDLAWRLIEHHHSIRYEADISVYHPHTEISRHPDGWWRTGRNRVLIARSQPAGAALDRAQPRLVGDRHCPRPGRKLSATLRRRLVRGMASHSRSSTTVVVSAGTTPPARPIPDLLTTGRRPLGSAPRVHASGFARRPPAG